MMELINQMSAVRGAFDADYVQRVERLLSRMCEGFLQAR
jgi:hypothetical protein